MDANPRVVGEGEGDGGGEGGVTQCLPNQLKGACALRWAMRE